MLDQHTRGCITTDSLLFLEKDPQKRASVLRERTRRRMKRRPPEAHKSEKIIHKLVMETTAMGNKHWSQVPEGHVAVGRPRSGPVLPKVRPIRRVSSAPDLGLDVKTLFDDKVELPGTPPVTPPGILELRMELRVRKEERRPVPSCRKAYCGGLVPLPSLRKGSQVAQPKMLPEELVLKGAKPKKAKKVPIGPTFDPSQLSHFLSSTQESIWRHYFGDAKGHEPPMLEDADRDVTDAVAE
ncbi:unnamed protein product [Durusdinium trenchii]|uniref:Ribosome biogenesis protein NOP53 n=3 Tax=Durusdinium trenchii TaxID=1381693 RepID=A0ABP0I297_9DINO